MNIVCVRFIVQLYVLYDLEVYDLDQRSIPENIILNNDINKQITIST